jgi:uncharacterized DUF497 family protein
MSIKPVKLFNWDQWNVQKNELKHGVSAVEAESAFGDPFHLLFRDHKHSTVQEARFILFGWSSEKRILMVGFTIRKAKIRVITARPASRKERAIYEKNR